MRYSVRLTSLPRCSQAIALCVSTAQPGSAALPTEPVSTAPVSAEPVADFSSFGLPEPILRAVNEIGYETPSPIQAAAIEPLLAGKDIFGQAQTGTGKTAAFALPLLGRLDLSQAHPQVLVLTPTRELAIQVAEAFQTYARHLPGFHVLPVYGGQSFGLQLRPLQRGVHVVVGTPGRVADHLRRGTLNLSRIRSFVLDEADEMLRMGFIDEVENILAAAPAERQLALFSATMPEPVKAIARRHANQAVEIRIKSRTSTVEAVAQRYWHVSGVHKLDALTRLLETEDFDAMVVFVRTKTATTFLAERLEARGFSCSALNGDMNQELREQTIARLRSGALDILVATDVAARGLDVARLSHVINYDIPYDTEAYVHRIGRTGRAGRGGHAIVFVAPREKRMLRSIERATGQTITQMTLPTHADVANKRTDRFKDKLTAIIESVDLTFFESVVQSYQEEHDVEPGKVAAALAFMAQGKRRLAPEPEGSGGKGAREDVSAGRPTPARSERPAPRAPRDPRPHREAPSMRRDTRRDEDGARVRYRIEVGESHGVQPKNIVGAIANEAGLDSKSIGPIRIENDFSLVTLPDGMPKPILNHLQKVWICGRQLRMSVDDGHAPPAARPAGDQARSHGEGRRDRPGKDRPGSERPRADRPRSDGSRSDGPRSEGPSNEPPRTDGPRRAAAPVAPSRKPSSGDARPVARKPAHDKPRYDKPGPKKADPKNPGAGKPGTAKSPSARPGASKSRADEPGSFKPAGDKPGSSKGESDPVPGEQPATRRPILTKSKTDGKPAPKGKPKDRVRKNKDKGKPKKAKSKAARRRLAGSTGA